MSKFVQTFLFSLFFCCIINESYGVGTQETTTPSNLPASSTDLSKKPDDQIKTLNQLLAELLFYSQTTKEKPATTPHFPTVSTIPERSAPSPHSCGHLSNRRECGYPGISPQECHQRRCCWDHRIIGQIWCFFPKNRNDNFTNEANSVTNQSTFYRPDQRAIGNFNSPDPDLNTFPHATHSQTVPTRIEESSVEQTIYPTISNTQYSHTTDVQQIATRRKKILGSLYNSATRSSSLFRQNEQQNGSNSPNSTQGTSPFDNPLKNLQKLAELLKLVEELERLRANLPSTLSPQQQSCSSSSADSCCRSGRSGPCCEFERPRNAIYRAAPLPRIVGGYPAGSLRNSVAHLSKLPNRRHFCGGTLINSGWVLTAAHCVLEYCYNLRSKSFLLVSLGKYMKAPFFRDVGQQDIGVSDVICHPNQCKPSLEKPRYNDVALLRLIKTATFTRYVQPALMPQYLEYPQSTRNCIALGWGGTRGSGYGDRLKQVSVPLIPNNRCNLPGWRECTARACMICAGDINIDPCDGDSGGPLFCPRHNGLYVLHGVFSWGRCGTEVRKPSIYTRTSHFVQWINSVTRRFTSGK